MSQRRGNCRPSWASCSCPSGPPSPFPLSLSQREQRASAWRKRLLGDWQEADSSSQPQQQQQPRTGEESGGRAGLCWRGPAQLRAWFRCAEAPAQLAGRQCHARWGTGLGRLLRGQDGLPSRAGQGKPGSYVTPDSVHVRSTVPIMPGSAPALESTQSGDNRREMARYWADRPVSAILSCLADGQILSGEAAGGTAGAGLVGTSHMYPWYNNRSSNCALAQTQTPPPSPRSSPSRLTILSLKPHLPQEARLAWRPQIARLKSPRAPWPLGKGMRRARLASVHQRTAALSPSPSPVCCAGAATATAAVGEGSPRAGECDGAAPLSAPALRPARGGEQAHGRALSTATIGR